MISLEDLVKVANQQLALESQIEECEQELKDKNEMLRKISKEILPNMMAEIGIESSTLPGGYKVGIDNVVFAKLPPNPYEAFEWLRKHNMDGVIKTQVILNYGKGEDKKVEAIQEMLTKLGETPEVKSNIHHMTLKALVKEQIEKGTDIPLDAFCAGTVRTSVISE